jgi:hypothetical protein
VLAEVVTSSETSESSESSEACRQVVRGSSDATVTASPGIGWCRCHSIMLIANGLRIGVPPSAGVRGKPNPGGKRIKPDIRSLMSRVGSDTLTPKLSHHQGDRHPDARRRLTTVGAVESDRRGVRGAEVLRPPSPSRRGRRPWQRGDGHPELPVARPGRLITSDQWGLSQPGMASYEPASPGTRGSARSPPRCPAASAKRT